MNVSGMKEILIVEDSATQAELVRYSLDRHGFSVRVAGNGVQALSLMQERRPDIIVSDVVMPEMDGYEFCRRVKEDPAWKQIPVILLTSLSDPRDVLRGLECGADNFIVKPYDESYLLSRLQFLIANAHLKEVETAQFGIEIVLAGEKHFIKSDRISILNLLLSSYEIAILKNGELTRARDELQLLNESLEEKVAERTSEITQELKKRKEVEHELQQVKNYLSNIIDFMPSILIGICADEVVTHWNREAVRTTGIPACEAIGRQVRALVPEFYPWIENLRGEARLHGTATLEKLLLTREGERSFYDLMLYQLATDSEQGAVVRIEDVTERTRIQELMVQTEKMMSVGGLAAGMAHEINNPLGIISQAGQNIERRLCAELPANRRVASELGVDLVRLRRYLEQRQVPQLVDSIQQAASRAARIIANMLQFSRQAPLVKQPASLERLIEQALELAANDYDLKKKYDFRAVAVVKEFQPDLPEVPVVAVEIEQVILNLVRNAAQAMSANPPERRPQITFRLRTEEKYAVLEVEDCGPGMEEKVMRRVFEPFFTTKEPGVGTGLGLSISYMIITANHKGLLEVASAPGAGARFTIRLPLTEEAQNG